MAGVSKGTVRRRMKDEAFRARVVEFRREATHRTLGLLLEAMPDAVAALHLQVADPGSPGCVSAAKAILEHGLKYRNEIETDERLTRLEKLSAGDTEQAEESGEISPGADRPHQ